MTPYRLTRSDCIGLARPAVDAHTLGLTSLAQLLEECGCRYVFADSSICACMDTPDSPGDLDAITQWIWDRGISVLGFSYRLDPQDGARLFGRLVNGLKARRMLVDQEGPLRAVYFAGLPPACELVRRRVPELTATFEGDETPAETLERLGVDTASIPRALSAGLRYDEDRLAFGRELVRKGDYLGVKPVDRSGYREFGTRRDGLVVRMRHGVERDLPPLMRAHMGPYLADRDEAVGLFMRWCGQLARSGFLDVLSIGTSQLSQSHFGEDWGGRPNGGGVPLNSRQDYAVAWEVSRPMLVRTYAGTKDVAWLARMYEESINIAWHALSLWWFCQIDGRGPYPVRHNLQQHTAAIRYIASTAKPFEANVSHHFAFRGADDTTCVVSAVIAARVAKSLGIRHFVLQNMLNTPKYTWGIQDLAKARATLYLVRQLEDDGFRVILQPRGGLDYFSHVPEKAKAQLAAVTALMDDIEPDDGTSPSLIHVVSFSEGVHLADPPTIDESIQITRHALAEYRRLRRAGEIVDMGQDMEVASRAAELVAEVRAVIEAIEATIPDPYSPEGLYRILAGGYLAVPYLWGCRGEFPNALRWQTRLIRGGMKVVDENGAALSAEARMERRTRSHGGMAITK